MKLKKYPFSLNGNIVANDEFGFVIRPGMPFTPEAVDMIQFHCRGRENRICGVYLTLGPPQDDDGTGKRRWHWDGNMESPTIEPSIGCDARCGWHGNVTSGEWKP